MEMKLNKNKFALASSATMGIVYVVCRFFVLVAPSSATKLLGWWIHTFNLEQFTISQNFVVLDFISGLVSVIVLSYIVAYIFVVLYNKFLSKN